MSNTLAKTKLNISLVDGRRPCNFSEVPLGSFFTSPVLSECESDLCYRTNSPSGTVVVRLRDGATWSGPRAISPNMQCVIVKEIDMTIKL